MDRDHLRLFALAALLCAACDSPPAAEAPPDLGTTDPGADAATPLCDPGSTPLPVASLDELRAAVVSLRPAWRFHTDPDDSGAAAGWAGESFDDGAWETLDAGRTWEDQGHPGYDGVAWYRRRVTVPAAWQGSPVRFVADGVDDEYDLYVNGQLIKHHGERPSRSVWGWRTETRIDAALRFGQENLIVVRVNDWGDGGGLWRNVVLKRTVDLAPYRSYLPGPILDGNPEWVSLYWLAWQLALQKISFGTADNGLRPVYLDEGFNEQIYQWDSTFMSLYARYATRLLPPMSALDNFYDRQRSDGYIQRVYSETDGRALAEPTPDEPMVNPPLFAWAEWLYFRTTGDASRLPVVFPKLELYFEWLKNNLRAPEGKGLYYQTDLGSGMDNTPRGDAWHAAWVDMSLEQALAARVLGDLARALNRPDRAAVWDAERAALVMDIDQLLWNDTDGYYYDLQRTGTQAGVRHVGAFWALVAGVADASKAARLIDHLRNPQEFHRGHLFPSLAASDPNYSQQGHYWRGGVWAPTNYMIARGLLASGADDLAREAAASHLGQLAQIVSAPPTDESRVAPEERDGDYATLWECYSPDASMPGTRWDDQYYCRQDFVGWTGLGPIATLIEVVLGLEVVGAENTIVWTITRTDRHGLENLALGADNRVDLVADPRALETDPVTVTVHADRPFTLEVRRPGHPPSVHALCSGMTQLLVD